MPALKGSSAELRFLDHDSGVDSVLVDAEVRVESVVLRVSDRDDLGKRAESVTAVNRGSPSLSPMSPPAQSTPTSEVFRARLIPG